MRAKHDLRGNREDQPRAEHLSMEYTRRLRPVSTSEEHHNPGAAFIRRNSVASAALTLNPKPSLPDPVLSAWRLLTPSIARRCPIRWTSVRRTRPYFLWNAFCPTGITARYETVGRLVFQPRTVGREKPLLRDANLLGLPMKASVPTCIEGYVPLQRLPRRRLLFGRCWSASGACCSWGCWCLSSPTRRVRSPSAASSPSSGRRRISTLRVSAVDYPQRESCSQLVGKGCRCNYASAGVS